MDPVLRLRYGASVSGETPVDLAYERAIENIASQRTRLDNLRLRSTALVTAASVLAAFLGGQALADTTRANALTVSVADRSVQKFEAVGFGAFLAVLFICAWIVAPRYQRAKREHGWQLWRPKESKDGWLLRLGGAGMLTETDELRASFGWRDEPALAQRYKRQLVGDMHRHHKHNEAGLRWRFLGLTVAILALGVEAVGFGLDLIL